MVYRNFVIVHLTVDRFINMSYSVQWWRHGEVKLGTIYLMITHNHIFNLLVHCLSISKSFPFYPTAQFSSVCEKKLGCEVQFHL